MRCFAIVLGLLGNLIVGIALAMLHPALGILYLGIWMIWTAVSIVQGQEAK